MPLTPEAPGPWVLGPTPGTGALLACDGARKALVDWLYLGEEIGEDDLFVTYENVYVIVAPWVDMVNEVFNLYLAASKRGDILPEDYDYRRVLFLKERAEFYLEELERVRLEPLWYQRQELYTFILRPLLFGLHFESYFDAESAVIEAPADYCLPQLLANNLGYSANYYRHFAYLLDFMFSQDGQEAWVDFWYTKPTDSVADAAKGPLERSHRWIDENVKPVAQNLAEIGGAAGEVAVEGIKTLAKVVRNPFGTAVALGALVYFLSTRK
jgi:hypothetical protein